ncbi:hypothetical protein [Neorhodopirellula pilleata]|uniref:HEAT repeat protein n=1 Tax=Neorhodopirellula pilleata TaxID=2714738 RepID=A0A5C6A550_9BACT|nr:hypothetical protein [Neorhodopirellula pilleata]TWT95054.1 hypothetical protein Pla100_36350 [Neorhodopirellula pilleata]
MFSYFFRPSFAFILLVACLSTDGFAQRSLLEDSDPAVEQTMLRAQRGPADLGQAISALTRMGEFENVEQLLGSIQQRGFNEAQKNQVAAEISSSERLRIVNHPQVSGTSIKTLDELFELRAKQLQSPDRLGKAIEGLLSSDPDQALPAIRILFQGGEASTAALVRAIVGTTDANRRDVWLRAMLRIDAEAGVEAIRRLALYGTPSARSGAIAALIRLDPNKYPTEMILALHRRGDTDSDAARMVAEAIEKQGESIPTRTAVVAEFRRQLEESMRIAVHSVRDIGRTEAWVVTKDREAVKRQRLPAWTLSFRDAADAAARLAAIGDDRPGSVTDQVVAVIAYEVANNPDWGGPNQVESFYQQYIQPALVSDGEPSPIDSPADLILPALRRAVSTNNDPAALGLIRLVNNDRDSVQNWLAGSGREVSALVAVVDHPNSTVRYEAAAAIAGLNPTMRYAGSTRVQERWMQMSRLGNRGSAIILENRPEVVAAWERLMNQAGLEPVFVSTARQLEAIASIGDDVRMIISKAEPKDVAAVELTDLVRRIRMTRDVPLLFYNDPPPQLASPEPEEVVEELNAEEAQAAADEAATVPDKYGIIGGIENIEGVVEKELLYGDLDIDSTTRRVLDLEYVGRSRWQDVSLRAGMISQVMRPRSVAGLYEILLESRRRQHLPPLSPIDRNRFRQIAVTALSE